jgi:SEFIR domain-containing protein
LSDSIPRVFISYSHDSLDHKNRVLGLSERLRQDGLETSLDQYVRGTPPQKWHRWMLDQLDWADFVLVICTETYYRRFRGREEPGKGKGADWEGALITQEIHDARSATTKFVPVIFELPTSASFLSHFAVTRFTCQFPKTATRPFTISCSTSPALNRAKSAYSRRSRANEGRHYHFKAQVSGLRLSLLRVSATARRT